jgi:2-alkenal reductase
MEGLAVGQTVVAIGNPFGYEGTLTRGIISGLGRTIPALTIFSIPQSIQTDAAINPGNSGGPLFNMRGEVIGVNAQIVTGDNTEANSVVGFAIPVSIVNRVVPSLVQNGEYIWPWMGVAGGDVTLSLVKAMDLADDKGAYIADVADNGPAEKAGLRGGTSNVTIDGQPVNSFDDMLVYVALQTSPGQEVVLTVLRDGEPMDITLELERSLVAESWLCQCVDSYIRWMVSWCAGCRGASARRVIQALAMPAFAPKISAPYRQQRCCVGCCKDN